jgi:hypothetical protein
VDHRTAAELAGIEAAIAQRSARLLISPLNGAMAEDSFADEFRRSLERRNSENSTGFS